MKRCHPVALRRINVCRLFQQRAHDVATALHGRIGNARIISGKQH